MVLSRPEISSEGNFRAARLVATKETDMLPELEKLPASSACRLIPFEETEVRPGFINDTFFLIVSGTKPYLNMKVSLVPRIYVQQPEYWGIEVVGCLPGGIGLPALAPYTVTIPLDGIRGKKGIEVIGANDSKEIDV